MDAIKAHRFLPGDRILLRAGDRFSGQLELASSGNSGHPIVIARYGEGARPIVDGAAAPDGGYSAAVLVRNQHDIQISGLEIVNAVGSLRPGQSSQAADGVLIVDDGGGPLGNFLLRDLYVHDIFARTLTSTTEAQFNKVRVSGIRFHVTPRQTRTAPSFFRDVRITGNLVSRTGRFGVQMDDPGPLGERGADARDRDPDTGFNRDILIDNNRFVETGGSGVQLSGARMALIDNNTFDRCGSKAVPDRMVGRGSGAWVINSRDIVAQHNRSRHVRGSKDSYGMHVDFGNQDVIYQYNYSEDSEGGFIEVLGDNRNITWRYNISVNDGFRHKNGNTIYFSAWSPHKVRSDGIYIYNNTIYVGGGLSPDISLTARHATLWNNIFYVAPGGVIGQDLKLDMGPASLVLHNNLFFGATNAAFTAMGTGNVQVDPRLRSPGRLAPAGYRLLPGSPAQRAGVDLPVIDFPQAGKGVFARISSRATVDFFGNPIATRDQATIGADSAGLGDPRAAGERKRRNPGRGSGESDRGKAPGRSAVAPVLTGSKGAPA